MRGWRENIAGRVPARAEAWAWGRVWDRYGTGMGQANVGLADGSERVPEGVSVGSEDRKVSGVALCSWGGLAASCGSG